jgi:hypothetical protein|tara:strand:- start:53 stop:256 length:204 start_codon:yes stop_codon:yes gene_type:complete
VKVGDLVRIVDSYRIKTHVPYLGIVVEIYLPNPHYDNEGIALAKVLEDDGILTWHPTYYLEVVNESR